MVTELIKKYRFFIVFVGDMAVFCLSAALVLTRYGTTDYLAQLNVHLKPFLIILLIWLFIYYLANLYTHKAFANFLEIIRGLTTTLLISFSVTIAIFYIFSRFFELTPKANLIALVIIFWFLDIGWRYLLRIIFLKKDYCRQVLALDSSDLISELKDHTKNQPHIGYQIHIFDEKTEKLETSLTKYSADLILINNSILKNNQTIKTLYGLIRKPLEIMTVSDFYESLFRFVPLSEIEEEWFIREITKNRNLYESVKRFFEIILVSLCIIISLIPALIIALIIRLTSSGPIIYKQERMGKNNKPFILYKFRTMKTDQAGPLWTEMNDSRVTIIGKFLRHTHLDEIPQLWNVLKGEISFIGPRPERTKLVEIYKEIPYYEIRHIIKPGIIGWAQLNYPASTTVEEAKNKFEYDLYYIKNRSLILDLFIILKTIRKFF